MNNIPNNVDKGTAIYNYIEKHQDDNKELVIKEIATKFNVSEEDVHSAIFRWAFGDRSWFAKTFN